MTTVMTKHILFLQGGAGIEDHEEDAKLVESLNRILGRAYVIHYPLLPEESTPDFGRIKQINKELSALEGDIILMGHSLGASMLLKYLSEHEVNKKIIGVFLISTPFWSGDEDWKQGFILRPDFADKLPQNVPVFLYHCIDDEVVPFEQLSQYKKKLPGATVREIPAGGHQLNDDLAIVAKDIKSL